MADPIATTDADVARITAIRDTIRWLWFMALPDDAEERCGWLKEMVADLEPPVDLSGCPLCQEIECDDLCPLGEIRSRLNG
jgi:hypothetical protein